MGSEFGQVLLGEHIATLLLWMASLRIAASIDDAVGRGDVNHFELLNDYSVLFHFSR